MRLNVAITAGLLAGLALGLLASATGAPWLLAAAESVEPAGTAFVNLLRMVVIPLVAATVFVGVAGLGDLRKLGRLGALAMSFFASTTAIGVLLGMGTMRLFLPLADPEAARAISPERIEQGASMPGVVDFLLGLIPSNPFRAASDGALLPLIFFVLCFAAAASTLPRQQHERLLSLAEAITSALIKLVYWVLWTAPLGVFALAAPVTARSGWAVLQSLLVFILAVLVGLSVFVAAVYLPAVKMLGRYPIGPFLRACVGPQVIGATTTSSAAAIPAMLAAAEGPLGVSRPVAGFVVSLGAALNRAGSALFQGAGLVFLAWLYNVPLPLAGVAGAAIATFLVAFTVAGVPGGSVVSLAPALSHTGVPLDGLGILLGVDRIPDMLRTATNVTGHLATSVVAERMLGRRNAAQSNALGA
ncbi:MAG: amino acid:proton symporter [Gemmatimonadales bacterium]|nr:MAG: amino acid:proton symporter [Gemmatimonadales bacterium]